MKECWDRTTKKEDPPKRRVFGLSNVEHNRERKNANVSREGGTDEGPTGAHSCVCVLLQDLWGYSQHEIADALGIRESAVSANVSRGHKQLRTAYWNMMHAKPAPKKGGQTR